MDRAQANATCERVSARLDALRRSRRGQAEAFGGARSVGGELQMIGAAEQRADPAGRRFPRRSRRSAPRDDRAADDLDATCARATVSNVRRSMFVTMLPKRSTRITTPRDAVVDDLAASACPARWKSVTGRPSAVSCNPLASHAAAGAKRSRPSNVRLTVGRAYRRSVSSTTRLRRIFAQHDGQHAVVGRDEPVVARLRRDAAARAADAGIDDDEEDRAGGKVRGRPRRARERRDDVVRRDVVA